MNTGLRIGLLVWVIVYLFLSCSPILSGNLFTGALALFGGLVLFVPWLVGIVVLWIAIQVTNPPRR